MVEQNFPMADVDDNFVGRRQPSAILDTARVAALLLGGVFAIIAMPVFAFLTEILFYSVFPWHSAEHYVEAIRTNVRLEFYLVWDEAKEDGRYLTISSPAGRKTFEICGFDWAHYSRTNLYLTKDNDIAVEGFDHCDYVVAFAPDMLKLIEWRATVPAEWTYLGAFEIVADGPRREKKLRFIDASEGTQ
jgi:hypothetical protein